MCAQKLGTKLHSGLHDEAPLKVAAYLPPAADPQPTSCRVPYWCDLIRGRRLHNDRVRRQTADGFLQTSLSKILGDRDPASTSIWLASDFRSTLAVLRTGESVIGLFAHMQLTPTMPWQTGESWVRRYRVHHTGCRD